MNHRFTFSIFTIEANACVAGYEVPGRGTSLRTRPVTHNVEYNHVSWRSVVRCQRRNDGQVGYRRVRAAEIPQATVSTMKPLVECHEKGPTLAVMEKSGYGPHNRRWLGNMPK
jgi:hypothetical protein